MITLNIKLYCNNCWDFEPKITKITARNLNGEAITDTIITCEHACRCEEIKNFLDKNGPKEQK